MKKLLIISMIVVVSIAAYVLVQRNHTNSAENVQIQYNRSGYSYYMSPAQIADQKKKTLQKLQDDLAKDNQKIAIVDDTKNEDQATVAPEATKATA